MPKSMSLRSPVYADEDVVRVDVAVDDVHRATADVARLMGVAEALAELDREVDDVREREDPPLGAQLVDDVAQRLAADVLHGDVVVAVDLAHLVDLDDVVVVEARDELRLGEEHVEVVASCRGGARGCA
jgi:hypothetical protein